MIPDQIPSPKFKANGNVIPTDTDRAIEACLLESPQYSDVIYRALRTHLVTSGFVRLEELEGEEVGTHPNELPELPWTQETRERINTRTKQEASHYLSAEEVQDLLEKTIEEAKSISLADYVAKNQISRPELLQHIQNLATTPGKESSLPISDAIATRVRLSRLILSEDLNMVEAAKRYLPIEYYKKIVGRTIGLDDTVGRIGGKAAGELIAYNILRAEQDHELHPFPIAVPFSRFIGPEVLEAFLDLNHLGDYRSRKYWPIEELAESYNLTRETFRNGRFPESIEEELRTFLSSVGENPIIVRSSSLLEDGTGAAFSGKYTSIFLVNSGPIDERLAALRGAIGEVYASLWSPDAISYRKQRGLLDEEEGMAILLQKVVGRKYGKYFFPLYSGVAFSRNDWAWCEKIKREEGLVRLVMGLGTEAVDRQGSDYARLVALSSPLLRTEATPKEISYRSQRQFAAIDTEMGKIVRVTASNILELPNPERPPLLDTIVSTYFPEDNSIRDCVSTEEGSKPIITFNLLLRGTEFTKQLTWMLSKLESCLGVPVDIEFASDGEKIYLLQCRPKAQYREASKVQLPSNIPQEDIFFEGHRGVSATAELSGINYIVYVDPEAYSKIESREQCSRVASVIRKLNDEYLHPRHFILVGPGRWGSNRDSNLGVPVGFSNICNSALLVEVADPEFGYSDEVSFGTHFFNDLVEADIHCIPLFRREKETILNDGIFRSTQNSLTTFDPSFGDIEHILKVIDIPAISNGRLLRIVLSGESQSVMGYLE